MSGNFGNHYVILYIRCESFVKMKIYGKCKAHMYVSSNIVGGKKQSRLQTWEKRKADGEKPRFEGIEEHERFKNY